MHADGAMGETYALNYLKSMGYKMYATNFRTRVGEVDIICKDGETLVFVEVKIRSSSNFGEPYESISAWKKYKIVKTAQAYLANHRLGDIPMRFDAISIIRTGEHMEVMHLKNVIE